MESNYDPYVRVLHSEGDEEDDLVPWCTDGDHGRCKAYLAKVISVDEDGSCDELGEDDSAEEYPPLVITENGMYDADPGRAQTNASFTSLSRGFRGCTYVGEAKEMMFGENLDVAVPMIYNSERMNNESENEDRVYGVGEGAADPSTDDVTFENSGKVSPVGEVSVDDPSGGSEPRAPSRELGEVASEPSGAGDDVTDNRGYMGRPRNNLVSREYLKISGILGFAAELINTTIPGDEERPSRKGGDVSVEGDLLSRPWDRAASETLPPVGRAPDAPSRGYETENNNSNTRREHVGHSTSRVPDAPDLFRTKTRAGEDACDVIKPFVLSDLKRLREERRVSVDEGEIGEEDKDRDCGDEASEGDNRSKTEEEERSAGEEDMEDLDDDINAEEYKEVKAVFIKECLAEEGEDEGENEEEEGIDKMIVRDETENVASEEDKGEIEESKEAEEEEEGGNEREAGQEEPQEELQHSQEENVAENLPCEERSSGEHPPQEHGEGGMSSENGSCEEQIPVEHSVEGYVDGSIHGEHASHEEQASNEPSPAGLCEEDPSSEGHHCEEQPSGEELLTGEDSSAKVVEERITREFLREEYECPSEDLAEQDTSQELFTEEKSTKYISNDELHSSSNGEFSAEDHPNQEHSLEEQPVEPLPPVEEQMCTDWPREEPHLEKLLDLSDHWLEEQLDPCEHTLTEEQTSDNCERLSVEEQPDLSEHQPMEEHLINQFNGDFSVNEHPNEEEQMIESHLPELQHKEEHLEEHVIVNQPDEESIQEQKTNLEHFYEAQDIELQADEERVEVKADEEQSFEKQSNEEQNFEKLTHEEKVCETQTNEEQDFEKQAHEEKVCEKQANEEQDFEKQANEEQDFEKQANEEQVCETQANEEQNFENQANKEQDFENQANEEQDFETQAIGEQDIENQSVEDENDAESKHEVQLEEEQNSESHEDHLVKEHEGEDRSDEEHPCANDPSEEQVGELKVGAEMDGADPVIEIDVGERTAGSADTVSADVDADSISVVSEGARSGCPFDVAEASGDEDNCSDVVSGSDDTSEGEKGGLAPMCSGQGDSDVISDIPSGPASGVGSGSTVDGEAGDKSALCCLEQDCHDEERVPEDVRGGEEHPCHEGGEGGVQGEEAERAWASADVRGVTKEHDVEPRTYAVSSKEQVGDDGGGSSPEDEALSALGEAREPASPSETLTPEEEKESSPDGSPGRVDQEEAIGAATPKNQDTDTEKDSEDPLRESVSGCVPYGSQGAGGECSLCASAESTGERQENYIVECQDRGTVVVGVRGVTFVEPLPYRDRYSPEVSIIWEEDTEVGDGEACDTASSNKPEIAKDSSLEGDFDSIILEEVAADPETVSKGQLLENGSSVGVTQGSTDDLESVRTKEDVEAPGVSVGEERTKDEVLSAAEGNEDETTRSQAATAEFELEAEWPEAAVGNLQGDSAVTDNECYTCGTVQDSPSFRLGARDVGDAAEVNEVTGGGSEEPIGETEANAAEDREETGANIIAKDCELRGEEESGGNDAVGGDKGPIRGSDKCGEVSERDRDEIGREEASGECASEGEGEEGRQGKKDKVLENLLILKSANSVECDEEWSAVDLVVIEAKGDQSSQEKAVRISVKTVEESSSEGEASAGLIPENTPGEDASAEACADTPKTTMSDSSNRDSGTSYLTDGEDSDDDTLEGRNSDGDAMMVSSTDDGSSGSSGSSGGTGGTGAGEGFSKSHRREDSGVEVGLESPAQHLHRPATPPRQRHSSCDTQPEEADPNDTTLTGLEGGSRASEPGSEASEAEDGGEGRFRRSRSHQFRIGRRFSSGHKMMEKMKKAVHFGRKTLLDDSAIDVHNTKHDANNAGRSFTLRICRSLKSRQVLRDLRGGNNAPGGVRSVGEQVEEAQLEKQ
ncbi:uncharacterized protein LOC122249478 [Penaeus japonicus]|uniref:uncharacterized protein LOC122249478 n=1 Tax=Penaeus japonicus TaxID=27405 RepID=UPI001C70B0D1|nr:uncharacterized protein LOC122249478 [Penaeus japonicus]